MIAAEGNNKTETNYFRNFQRDNVSIKTIKTGEYSFEFRITATYCGIWSQYRNL